MSKLLSKFTVRWFLGLAALAFLCGLAAPSLASAAPAKTVVSLEFDDGTSDQTVAGPDLAAAGMHGTFFINSGRIGATGFMARSDIQTLAAGGNEIGGHTVNHADLPTLTNDEATREICGDRQTLLADGFAVANLAYPYGDTSAAVEADAKACGYNSARTIGGVLNPSGCTGCDPAETIPPADPYSTNTPDSVKATETLAQLEGLVTQAESGGGWVQLVMHHICAQTTSGCDPTYSIDPTTLTSLLTWLKTQPVSVETVNQVIGGIVQPAVAGPQVPLPPAGNILADPLLDNVVTNPNVNNGQPYPNCWALGQSGTVTGTGTVSSTDVHAPDTSAEVVSASALSSGGDERLFSTQDLGGCAPEAQAGHSYKFSTWYHSTQPLTMEAYLRSSTGAWGYWADNGGATPAVNNYTQASWTTPAVPASGVFDPSDNLSCPCTGISVAVSLRAVGSFTADDLSLTDTDTTPPTVTLAAPANNSFVAPNANVTLSANASDTSGAGDSTPGVRSVQFIVNGKAIPSTSTTSPYTATWSTSGLTGAQTITAQATDNAGNVTVSPPTTVTIDSTPPTSTVNALPALSNPKTFKVSYTAADNVGGSGLAAVDLYAKAPGASSYSKVASDSGDASGTFNYTGSGDGAYSFYTLATDKVGNVQVTPTNLAEASTTLDATAPSSTASSAALSNSPTIHVSYTASDNPGGSGLAAVDLYAKAPGASAYSKVASDTSGQGSGAFTYAAHAGDGSYSFYTLATDDAGNSQSAPGSAQASTTLNTTPPSAKASSPGSSAQSSWTVSYTAAARDGSALTRVDLYAKAPGASTYSKVASDTSGQGSGAFTYAARAGDGSYSFYALATDSVGLVQSAPVAPDATTMLNQGPPSAFAIRNPGGYLRGRVGLALQSFPSDPGSALASASYQYRRNGQSAWASACTSALAPWACAWSTVGMHDGSYSLRALVFDAAGNSTASNTLSVIVDNTRPRATSIRSSGARRGKAAKGDTVTFTYSETINPSSVLAGWGGAPKAVQVRLSGKHRTTLSVWSANGRTRVALADPLALGGSYARSSSVTFAGSMVQRGSSITVTLRSLINGKPSVKAVTGGTLRWTPSTRASDLAGNSASPASVSAHGPAF